MPESARGTAAWDITRQLVDTERGRRLAVVMGGGRASFTPATNSSQQQVELETKVKRMFAKISQSHRRPLLGGINPQRGHKGRASWLEELA